ncbi:MAG: glycosidase [halophilic archaeon J07HX64]|nr:MAG: glycosidase [halophilic archaeon J07HX64]
MDAIWLTPILENDHAPHGYNITDFFSVASDLGSREQYEQLVEAAHDRDIRVLFDVVCNHSARTHPFFEDAVGDPDSEYRDWYEWRTQRSPRRTSSGSTSRTSTSTTSGSGDTCSTPSTSGWG